MLAEAGRKIRFELTIVALTSADDFDGVHIQECLKQFVHILLQRFLRFHAVVRIGKKQMHKHLQIEQPMSRQVQVWLDCVELVQCLDLILEDLLQFRGIVGLFWQNFAVIYLEVTVPKELDAYDRAEGRNLFRLLDFDYDAFVELNRHLLVAVFC